jgi:hypothetical protein
VTRFGAHPKGPSGQDVELCEVCDGASGLPATTVINDRLVCDRCRFLAENGPLEMAPDFGPSAEVAAALAEEIDEEERVFFANAGARL